ncbi:MAG: YdjY domain-containing protein [Planctomycetaceae bacterium]
MKFLPGTSILFCFLSASMTLPSADAADAPAARLPEPGQVVVDEVKSEVILSAKVQFPEDKPCINEFGQRVQAFAGCATAAGGDAKMAGYFVFLVDVDTETVFDGLFKLGARPRVHYSIQEGRLRSGLKPETKIDDYLQGDPVVLSVFWKNDDGKWVEKPYQDFATELVEIGDQRNEKPWTPHFVFHGSGAIHKSGTGCIACPCDCPGGIIADNRFPIYDPKPMVRFDMSKAPPAGTQVYVRIRPVTSRGE